MSVYSDALPEASVPYCMCLREECESRERTEEVSLFERQNILTDRPSETEESTSSGNAFSQETAKRPSSLQMAMRKTSSLQSAAKSAGNSSLQKSTKFSNPSPKRHIIDPRLAVAKYRRSAAGFTDRDRPPPRTLEQLLVTVQYLQRLLIAAPTISSDGVSTIDSWLQVVNFVQDRLRAVQVDLVVTGQTSKFLHYSMTRMYILINYLLLDVSDYSQKLGKDALQAFMSNYWNDPVPKPDWDDEMLSYSLILQCSTLKGNPFSFLELYRKRAMARPGPRFQWSLKFVTLWENGHWYSALKWLDQGFGDESFDVLVRCCLAPHLGWIRWKALEAYNVSWGKGECVKALELARVLYLRKDAVTKTPWDDQNEKDPTRLFDEDAALVFCKAVGLPVKTETKGSVQFKVAPLQPLDFGATSKFSVREDEFVCRYSKEDGNLRANFFGFIRFDIPSAKWMEKVLVAALLKK